ncbi:MAG: AhpC/TSA family protein [Acidobacteria bacterium]|nr:AhpC/TSA family protein [Acidobacteriota bacterium]
MLFFGQGSVLETKEFFDSFWPEARAVSDKEHIFYQSFGLKQATLSTMLTPIAWVRVAQTALKGNFVGKFVGDIWMMPGIFLIKNENIIWQHDFQHAGDHPDFAKIPQQIK